MKFRCFAPPAVLSEEVEQYLETPNQAFISRPWTSSKKSSVSFVCIDLSPYVAEGRTTARNKRANIAGDIFDRGMRAATLAQAAIWAAVFTFNPYLLISINEIIDINNSFIDINKYGHGIHLY